MNRLLSMLVTFVAFVTSQEAGQVVQDIGKGIGKELAAAKHPIEETISTVGSSQCSNVKKLFGVAYEQLEGEREPDVNQLKLVYKTRWSSSAYNISEASEGLRRARALQAPDRVLIYVHGFTDDPTKNSFTNISNALLQSVDGNSTTVLALDASPLIRWLYLRSSTYVIFIGQRLAEVLVSMVKGGLDPSHVHMVGHSLGAHISGFTGKHFYILTGRKIGRISGLDPAGPCFTFINDTFRLQASDAGYVDVIHTDGGVFGIRTPLGHADYFPNKGEQQPDCFLPTCSHSRAWQLFGESELDPHAFPARRCASWEDFSRDQCSEEISYMGYGSKPGTRGLFFLQTRGSSPYGLGINGTRYVNNEGIVRNVQDAVKNLPLIG